RRSSACSSNSMSGAAYRVVRLRTMTASGCARWLHGQPAALVANPTAHSGKAADWIRHARALLDEAAIPHKFVPTEPEGATVERVREVIDDGGTRLMIYMGGDGTFAEVAKGILASGHAADIAMGMLPTGTANDQGKSFGLGAGDVDLPRNVRVLGESHEARLDAGRLTAPHAAGAVVRDH